MIRKTRTESILLYGTYLVFTLFFLYPLWIALVGSLKTDAQVLSTRVFVPVFPPSLSSYGEVLPKLIRPMLVSFSVAAVVSGLGIFFGLLGGYVLSRKRSVWVVVLFSLVLFGNYIPPTTKVLPALKIMQFLGLYDTIIGLALSIGSMVLPLSTLLFRQFFIQIPESYFEAASIEGAHHLSLFSRIAVPLAKIPAFAVTVLTFAIGWNAYLIALVLTRGEAFERPIAITVVGLMEYAELYSKYNIMLAGGILASVPVVALFLATQRYTTAGFRSLGGLEK